MTLRWPRDECAFHRTTQAGDYLANIALPDDSIRPIPGTEPIWSAFGWTTNPRRQTPVREDQQPEGNGRDRSSAAIRTRSLWMRPKPMPISFAPVRERSRWTMPMAYISARERRCRSSSSAMRSISRPRSMAITHHRCQLDQRRSERPESGADDHGADQIPAGPAEPRQRVQHDCSVQRR